MTIDLTNAERRALAGLLTRAIEDARYPQSPWVRTLRAILDKLEPPAAVTAEPLPTSKPGDRPRGALAAMKRRRLGPTDDAALTSM